MPRVAFEGEEVQIAVVIHVHQLPVAPGVEARAGNGEARGRFLDELARAVVDKHSVRHARMRRAGRVTVEGTHQVEVTVTVDVSKVHALVEARLDGPNRRHRDGERDVRQREETAAIVACERNGAGDAIYHHQVEIAVAIHVTRDQADNEVRAEVVRKSTRLGDIAESSLAVVEEQVELLGPGARAVRVWAAVPALHVRAK